MCNCKRKRGSGKNASVGAIETPPPTAVEQGIGLLGGTLANELALDSIPIINNHSMNKEAEPLSFPWGSVIKVGIGAYGMLFTENGYVQGAGAAIATSGTKELLNEFGAGNTDKSIRGIRERRLLQLRRQQRLDAARQTAMDRVKEVRRKVI